MTEIQNLEEKKDKRNLGNILAGLVLLIAGGLLLAHQLGYALPGWFFGWEMLLIGIGFFVGARNRFKDYGWLIMVGVGVVFLMDDVQPELTNFIWPAAIIFVGLIMILRPGKMKKLKFSDLGKVDVNIGSSPTEDILDTAAVFGSVKKIVLSKNFKGGESVSVFGGTEINLAQADIEGPVKVEVVAIFGGVKLIIPSNWEIRSEVAAVLGGVEDKRKETSFPNPEKVLILEGVAVFGGIEIASY